MKGHSLRSLSIVGLLEGLSLIALLIAVPLKYLMAENISMRELGENMVHVIGPVHGGIFLLYIVIAVVATLEYEWNILRFLLIVLISTVPFGFLFVEFKIIRPEQKKLAENPNRQPSAANQKMYAWLKRIGVGGFLFFLGKGLVWIAIFAGLIKGCD
jgi:integral membrane protein